ncbi:hypothetical protein M9Y10_019137 [Tritrichomonas musculus]|uniref:BZIP domain-containing protein n=1 Tax=Tritrichomonas musculus TaxID=1915356 RepID=A0ABR2HIL9_9EUKA
MTNINTDLFNNTEVIKLLKNKQTTCDSINDSQIEVCTTNEPCDVNPVKPKSNRGRKKKYATDEERILARRAQQKAYRERKKKELQELRELKARLDAVNDN